jgi:hypothetical protein
MVFWGTIAAVSTTLLLIPAVREAESGRPETSLLGMIPLWALLAIALACSLGMLIARKVRGK